MLLYKILLPAEWDEFQSAGLFGETLRWEPAPNGGPFPHVYASLPLRAVVSVHQVAGAAQVDSALPSD
ncbi:DUF952 domain-containing protein [Plantactinospora sp. B5E13]|uniref:DUF952 domain-containing protein n=1 Tax=unclassified Plantactinospora TaxID=2631981 RepID=UPI00325D0F6A